MHTFVGLLQLHHVHVGGMKGLILSLCWPHPHRARLGWEDTVRAVRTDPSVRRRLRLCHGASVAGDAVGVTGAVRGGLGGVTGTRSSFWGSFHGAYGNFLSGAAVLAGLPGAVLGGLGCTLLPGAGGAGGGTKLLLRL